MASTQDQGEPEATSVAEVETEYQAWATANGLSLDPDSPGLPRHERAAALLEHIEAQVARRNDEADRADARGNREWARKRRAGTRHLEQMAERLFGFVNPPAINGQEYRAGFVACKWEGCKRYIETRVAFAQGGMCGPCWSVATGRTSPQGPRDDLEASVDAVLGDGGRD